MSALSMAVFFRGLQPDELNALVDAMVTSGDRLDFTGFPKARVDKHSIGGVGDKTSLLLAPMIACLGLAVPMISGRGLGHTGGTLDKLEAINGFRTRLSLREAKGTARQARLRHAGADAELVPADRKLYALRDVTGTVESIPLISASIMSKKLAEDLTGLGTRHQGWKRRVPHRSQGVTPARGHHDRHRRGPRLSHRRAPHRDGPTAWLRLWQRPRDRGSDPRADGAGTARP
jgi:hypothetical protein